MFLHRFTYNRWEDKTFESDAFHWRNPDGSEGGIVSDSARVDPSVFVAREAEVWPRASVGAATKIARGARVGLDCFVSIEVEIGEFVDLYSRSDIGLQARLEAGAAIYGARIGNLAVIGPKAEILGGASVGHGAGIGAEAIVCQDAGIGVGAVIGPRAEVPPDERIAENGCFDRGDWLLSVSCFGRARRVVTAVWSARRGLRFWLGIPGADPLDADGLHLLLMDEDPANGDVEAKYLLDFVTRHPSLARHRAQWSDLAD